MFSFENAVLNFSRREGSSEAASSLLFEILAEDSSSALSKTSSATSSVVSSVVSSDALLSERSSMCFFELQLRAFLEKIFLALR